MFMIVLISTLSDFISIFKNLMHLLENHNSISIHPAKCGRSTQCGPMYSPHPEYSYSPCRVKLLHTVSKHWKHLTAIKSCAVLMKQHISNISVSILKIGKNMLLCLLKSLTHLDVLHL